MAVTTTKINRPINPRGNDQSPKGYNRAALYSGKALDFDGTNDSVSITTSSFDLYAISFYFKGAIGTGTNGFVFHTGGATNDGVAIGHLTSTLTNETVTIGNAGNYTAINESYDDGIHFVVFSWDATNSKYKAYINAQEVDTFNNGSNAALLTGITAPKLGYRPSFNDFYLDGGLSNVRAFSTALTAAQVADLYNNPEKIVPTGVEDSALKLWLPMMEGAGTTAYDGSGNGNHGTISGATWTHGVGSPVAQTAVIDWNKGTNLVAYSEEFDQWTANSSSVTADDATAPDGQDTADKWKPNNTVTGADIRRTTQSVVSGNDYVFYVFAKAGEFDQIQLDYQNSRFSDTLASFDLTNGTLGSLGGDNVTEGIIDKGDGWYLCYVVGNCIASGSNSIIIRQNGGTGDGSKGYYLWGAGFAIASDIVPYIRTGSVNQTSPVLLPQGLTSGRDITGVNLFENVRKQGALNLDGNSWAEVHDNASVDLTTSLSLEVWCYPTEDGTSSGRELIGKFISSSAPYQCYALQYEVGKFGFGIGATDNAWEVLGSTTGKAKENWYHVVATYDGATRKIYINGVQDASQAYTKTPQTTDENIAIGRWLGQAVGGTNTFFGPIAQPRIYNRALTAEEVERNYNAGKNIYK